MYIQRKRPVFQGVMAGVMSAHRGRVCLIA
jgi:hypothetical protein